MDDETKEHVKRIIDMIDLQNTRLEKFKIILLNYLTLGNEFALSSLKTSLKNV